MIAGASEFVIPTRALNVAFLLALYVPICGLSYRWLRPRLTPIAWRIAAGFMLAQAAVIVLSLIYQLESGFTWWLWDLNSEWNLPTLLSAIQFASVGFAAIFAAWAGRGQPIWLRLYFVVIGLPFFVLGLDDLFQFHEANWFVETAYTGLGIGLALAASILVLLVPRRNRIWLFCLLTGLGLAGFGGFFLERYRDYCGKLASFQLSHCLEPYHYEEPLEMLGIWLVLAAVLGLFSDASPPARVQRALAWLPSLFVAIASIAVPASPYSIPALGTTPAVVFEAGESLHDHRVKIYEQEVNVRLSLSPEGRIFVDGLGYSIHLVDQVNGASELRLDRYAQRELKFTIGPRLAHVYRQDMTLSYTPDMPANRALWIVLTLWRAQADEYLRQPVASSDLMLLGDTQVVLGELALPEVTADPSAAWLAAFDAGYRLANVDLPERAKAGDALPIRFDWRSDTDGSEDYAQFLHFVHEDTGQWWGFDQQPLGPRLPTRLWYKGLADSETWQAPLPDDLTPGRYAVFTGLYRLGAQERVPARDFAGKPWPDNRVALGSLDVD